MDIYYRSLRRRQTDYLTVSRLSVAVGHRLVLVLTRLRGAEQVRAGALAAALSALRRLPQDRGVRPAPSAHRPSPPSARPAARGAGRAGRRGADPQRAADFLDFFQRDVGISPVWLCPLRLRGVEDVALVPARAGVPLRQFRLLVECCLKTRNGRSGTTTASSRMRCHRLAGTSRSTPPSIMDGRSSGGSTTAMPTHR